MEQGCPSHRLPHEMAIRFGNPVRWLRKSSATTSVTTGSNRGQQRTGAAHGADASSKAAKTSSDLHAHFGVEPNAPISRSGSQLSTGMGARHQLRQPEQAQHQHQLPSSQSILRDALLLRREIGDLKQQLQRLESSFALLAKAVEQRSGCRCSTSTIAGYDRLRKEHRKSFHVLELISVGKPVKAIAPELGVSIKTVDHHWRVIKRYLKLDNYVQAARIHILLKC